MNYLTISLPISKKGSLSVLKFFLILVAFYLIFVFLFTIFQMALYAQGILSIKNYERKIKFLKEENKNLEIEFSKTTSLSNLQDYLKDFEKVKNVKYIKLGGSSMAEK
jgi:hypothetical protein